MSVGDEISRIVDALALKCDDATRLAIAVIAKRAECVRLRRTESKARATWSAIAALEVSHEVDLRALSVAETEMETLVMELSTGSAKCGELSAALKLSIALVQLRVKGARLLNAKVTSLPLGDD